MNTTQPQHPRPVTRDDIDLMLDRLALEIEARGAEGEKLLPLFERLEDEAAKMDAAVDALARVRARLSMGRTAGQSAGAPPARA